MCTGTEILGLGTGIGTVGTWKNIAGTVPGQKSFGQSNLKHKSLGQKSLGQSRDFQLWDSSHRDKNFWDWLSCPLPIPGKEREEREKQKKEFLAQKEREAEELRRKVKEQKKKLDGIFDYLYPPFSEKY